MMTSRVSSLRLWQLISPALPVGAYAYSQGLEYALEAGWLKTEADVLDWIQGQLRHNLAHLDIPILQRVYQAWQHDDHERVNHWTRYLLASREAAELKIEDQNLGRALATLLSQLDIEQAEHYRQAQQPAFVTLLALAANHWKITLDEIAQGYLWMWCENQVAAAVKLVPLGQTSGQKMLLALANAIPAAVETGLSLSDDQIGMSAPGLGIASALHESQYSRLFRS
jgi:urease accessory protein